MSDRDALFQAILAAPDDDAPRLVYADWLDENGDPARAEFIRVQCRLARLPFYDPDYPGLVRRADELRVRYHRAWRIPDLNARQVFRRGFVETFIIEPDLFFARAADLFARAPIRWVEFTEHPALADWQWEAVARLEGIEFPGPPPGPILERFGPRLPRLRRLKATGLLPTADFLAAVECVRLEALDLTDSLAPAVDVEEFCRRTYLSRVRVFALGAGDRVPYGYRLRAQGARHLAAAPGLSGLRELHLHGQCVGDAGVYHLAHSPYLAGVEELYLPRNEIGMIGTTGIEDFCASPYLTRLRVLDLSDNPLGTAGARELAQWPGLRHLRWLDLSGCGLCVDDVRPLATSPHLHDGLTLCLHDNRFDPAPLFPPHMLRRAESVS